MINPPVNDDVYEGDSDEEIQELKQRIRIRKQEKLKMVSENSRNLYICYSKYAKSVNKRIY